MRSDLEKQIKLTEGKIAAALQEFHDNTSMVPTSFDFEMVDCGDMQDKSEGLRRCFIGEHALRARI